MFPFRSPAKAMIGLQLRQHERQADVIIKVASRGQCFADSAKDSESQHFLWWSFFRWIRSARSRLSVAAFARAHSAAIILQSALPAYPALE